MSSHIVLIEKKEDWLPIFPKVQTLTAREYLGQPDLLEHRGTHLINLCRSYRYLSTGYYCSLLAGARHHKALPSVNTLTALSRKSLYNLDVEDLDQIIQKTLNRRQPSDSCIELELAIYFGQASDSSLQGLARQIFDLFPCPILKVTFRRQNRWGISAIQPLPLNQLTPTQQQDFAAALTSYLSKPWRLPKPKRAARYDLAILHEPGERKAPSNPAALRKFIQTGRKLGVEVELIEKKDYGRLSEFDAMFIRVTTAIDHYTYRFARKAYLEGMAVIDDPTSIIRCTNKVFLAELLAAQNLPHPRTLILQKGERTLHNPLGFPVVLKIPDGSFSRGVLKANNAIEFSRICAELFKESDLILAQEFVYTPFDWRIGILNHQPLYACRYFMSRQHWQIVKYERSGRIIEGGFETLPVEQAPKEVVDTALKLADKIGDGLYGVDLKQTENGHLYVIEINDNPNIDSGIEDKVLGEELYRRIIVDFIRRIEERHEGSLRA